MTSVIGQSPFLCLWRTDTETTALISLKLGSPNEVQQGPVTLEKEEMRKCLEKAESHDLLGWKLSDYIKSRRSNLYIPST